MRVKLNILELFRECASRSKQYCQDKIDTLTIAADASIEELRKQISGKANTNHTHSYLPLSGGTVSGNTAFTKAVYAHCASGTSGTAGYVKAAQIKITANYQNVPLIFEVVNRSSCFPMQLFLQFASENNVDPALGSFVYFGANIGAHIVKSATSTWDLYIKKSEAYDNIAVTRYTTNAAYMTGVTVNWTNIHANSLPSGCTAASIASLNVAAAKAVQDSAGQQINATYVKSASVSGKTITFTRGDGKTFTIELDSMGIPTATPITIPTSGWQSDSTAGYPKYYDISVTGITAKDRAEITISHSSLDTAKTCGLCPTNETLAGKIRVRAASIPTAAISAEYWIMDGKE